MKNIEPDCDDTSPSLIHRVQRHDSAAWERFCSLYTPLLRCWAHGFGLQDSDASDVVQETLLSVMSSIATFEGIKKGQSLRAWMRTILRNKCRDLARRQKRHINATGGTDAHQMLANVPEQNMEEDLQADDAEDEAVVIRTAFELLKSDFEPHTWVAFVQTAIDGRKASDVAHDLGISVGSVYTAKSRVLAKFRHEFSGLIEFAESST